MLKSALRCNSKCSVLMCDSEIFAISKWFSHFIKRQQKISMCNYEYMLNMCISSLWKMIRHLSQVCILNQYHVIILCANYIIVIGSFWETVLFSFTIYNANDINKYYPYFIYKWLQKKTCLDTYSTSSIVYNQANFNAPVHPYISYMGSLL